MIETSQRIRPTVNIVRKTKVYQKPALNILQNLSKHLLWANLEQVTLKKSATSVYFEV